MRCQGVLRSIVGLGVAMGVSGTLGWSQGGGTQAEPQAASQFLRASRPYVAQSPTFLDGFTENKNVNSPWLARAAVREAKLHGVDWIKIYTTQDFVGGEYGYQGAFKPDGTMVNSPSLTFEEVEAIVDVNRTGFVGGLFP